MEPTCRQCRGPITPAEERAYGRCEDCWAGYANQAYGTCWEPPQRYSGAATGRCIQRRRPSNVTGPAV